MRNFAIRKRQQRIIDHTQRRIHQIHAIHNASFLAHLNPIAPAERRINLNLNASKEILERLLQRKAQNSCQNRRRREQTGQVQTSMDLQQNN